MAVTRPSKKSGSRPATARRRRPAPLRAPGRSSSAGRTEKPAPPHSRAKSAKSGLTRFVSHTGRMAPSCSRLILASSPLSSTMWVRGKPSFTAVVTSARYWPRPPSPEIDTTLRPEPCCRPHGHRRAERGREGEADGAEVAGHEDVLAAPALEEVAEAVGVVADVDGDHGVVGHERRSARRRSSAGWSRPWRVDEVRRRRLLRPPPLPSGWRPTSRCSGRSTSGSAGHQQRRSCGRCRPTAAPRRGGTCRGSSGRGRPGWSAPRWGSTCGWRTRRRARAGSRPAATVWQATGMPDRPRTPQPSGWSSGKMPLALNVVITGASRCSAKRHDCVAEGAGAVAADDRRPLGGPEQLRRPGPARRRAGRSPVAATRPAGAGPAASSSRRAAPGRRRGSTRWATSRCTMACFMASAASSVALPGERTVWLHSATASKAFSSGTSWKAPGPMTWVCTWPVSARTGTRSTLASHSPVSRLVAPGPGDREAGRRAAGQLGVARWRRRPRPPRGGCRRR